MYMQIKSHFKSRARARYPCRADAAAVAGLAR
jgi:hypothetical protein